jgi:hypothetical protein
MSVKSLQKSKLPIFRMNSRSCGVTHTGTPGKSGKPLM